MSVIHQVWRTRAVFTTFVVFLTAREPHIAVHTSVKNSVVVLLEAVTGVASNVALASASILTGTGVTLVYHLLAQGTCQHRNKSHHMDGSCL